MVQHNKTKVIVFDLDGTLYEDTHHFNYYAGRLQEKLPVENRLPFWNDYETAASGNHTLRIGRVYDAKRDLVLLQQEGIVTQAFYWDGTSVDESKLKELYKEKITIDLDSMLSVGDLWWVPASIARHYGLSGQMGHEAFLETRKYMMSSEFQMKKINSFKETLLSLKDSGIKNVLLTKSPKEDSEVILSKLELETVFDKKIFDGKKPTFTSDRFEEIAIEFKVDYREILSVGDNWINEILPAKKLGCSTVLIDAHAISDDTFADKVVKNISEVIPILHSLN